MKKRIISFIIVCLLSLSCLTVLSSADAQLSNANDVIAPELREVMNASKAADKIPVSIWTEEIDSAEVEELALKKTGYNKESIRALVEQGKGDTVTLDDVNEYIAVERKLYAEKQQSANQKFAGKYTFLTEAKSKEDAYVCSYAPMIVVSLTKSQIETLAKDSMVNIISYSPKMKAENMMSTSVPTVDANYTRDTLGYNGAGIRIGMVECGIPVSEDENAVSWVSHALRATNTDGVSYSSDDILHAVSVAEVMVSNDTRENGKYKGIVPNASLYSAALGDNEDSNRVYAAVEWLLSQNVHVINMSGRIILDNGAGKYTEVEKWFDHIAHNHSVHFVASAGNYNPESLVDEPYVTHPALAYNVIAVGNLDDKNTTSLISDVLAATSCYNEIKVASSVTPPNKPDIVAPGENISTSTFHNVSGIFQPVSGTSIAAPHVTGIVAQLIQQYPSLAVLQDLTKAILTAAIDHPSRRYTSANTNNFDKYGAGCVNALACTEVSYRGTFASSAFSASSTTPKTYTFNAPSSAAFVRGSLVWLKSTWYSGSNHTGNPAVDADIANLSITVTTPNGQELTFEYDGRTNMIIFELDPDVYGYGNYTVEIGTTGSNTRTYFGFAWWY
ncbi:MAG: S8 family serine peptidase [Clostridia bacterium]|nr:S8 family serine peptidase [Clostridia bacterium]